MVDTQTRIALFFGILILAGCQSIPGRTAKMQNTFDVNEYKAYTEKGPGKLSGQAFLKQNGGAIVTCAGNDVYLIPDTAYFREMLTLAKRRTKPETEADKEEMRKIRLKTVCDAQGNFEFNDVPLQKYIIVTTVEWKIGYNRQGGGLIQHIEFENSTPIKTILSDSNRL